MRLRAEIVVPTRIPIRATNAAQFKIGLLITFIGIIEMILRFKKNRRKRFFFIYVNYKKNILIKSHVKTAMCNLKKSTQIKFE